MAFNVKNTAHLAALKTELALDRYVPYLERTKALLSMLNDPANHEAGGNISTPYSDLMISDVGMEIDSVEYAALTAYGKTWIKMLISRDVGEDMAPFLKKFAAMFVGGSDTRNAIDVIRSHPASRAEVMFGAGTKISRGDAHTARDS